MRNCLFRSLTLTFVLLQGGSAWAGSVFLNSNSPFMSWPPKRASRGTCTSLALHSRFGGNDKCWGL